MLSGIVYAIKEFVKSLSLLQCMLLEIWLKAYQSYSVCYAKGIPLLQCMLLGMWIRAYHSTAYAIMYVAKGLSLLWHILLGMWLRAYHSYII